MNACLVLLGIGMSLQTMAQQPQMDLPRARLSAGMHLLDVQLAQTPQERQIGLMFRREMPRHRGHAVCV